MYVQTQTPQYVDGYIYQANQTKETVTVTRVNMLVVELVSISRMHKNTSTSLLNRYEKVMNVLNEHYLRKAA